MSERSLVIDTDTASDDAVALLMAARTPGVVIRAVTTVAGNVPLPLATRNALVTLEFAGAGDVPVHEGRSGPLLRPLQTAQFVHGENGMGGVEFADPARSAEAAHAVDALRTIATDEPGRHTLVTLGPLSNIATALLIDPMFLTRFEHVYLMAGAFDGVGNIHPVGEYNVWTDPEAARIVMDAPGDKTYIGWDMSRRFAVVTPREQAALRGCGRFGSFVVDINASVDEFCRLESGLAGFDLPDPLAMAVAIDPTVVTGDDRCHVTVGVDETSRGGTFVDHRLMDSPAPNAIVVRVVDDAKFHAILLAACRED
jgi:purine nucleosidase